jgi:hypothetical protein
MASLSDRATGGFFLLVALLVFTYYTVWVMALVRTRNMTGARGHGRAGQKGSVIRLQWTHRRRCLFVRSAGLSRGPSMQPFLDPSHALHSLFPPRNFAILIPVALLVLGVSGIGAFLASVLIKSEKKKKAA